MRTKCSLAAVLALTLCGCPPFGEPFDYFHYQYDDQGREVPLYLDYSRAIALDIDEFLPEEVRLSILESIPLRVPESVSRGGFGYLVHLEPGTTDEDLLATAAAVRDLPGVLWADPVVVPDFRAAGIRIRYTNIAYAVTGLLYVEFPIGTTDEQIRALVAPYALVLHHTSIRDDRLVTEASATEDTPLGAIELTNILFDDPLTTHAYPFLEQLTIPD